MSLKEYCVDAQDPVLEERLWSVFPTRGIYFWPYLLMDAEGLEQFLERDMPVSVSTTMTGIGRFTTTIKWLTPWLKVQWYGQLWCVSKEGRMWNVAEMKAYEKETEGLEGPVWHMKQLREDLPAPPAGVCAFPISADAVSAFLNEYQSCSWFKTVQDIVWDRRAGADLFRLKLKREKQSFEVLIQNEKYEGQDLGAVLEDIFSKLWKEGGDHLIDATYEGKILLRGLPDVSEEGSMK